MRRGRRARGQDRPERFVPMLNAARSPTFYEFDSADLLRCTGRWTPTTRSRWSSTTRTPPPRPTRRAPTSPTPPSRNAHYVLVSTRRPEQSRVPVVPHRRRRGHRGAGGGGRELCVDRPGVRRLRARVGRGSSASCSATAGPTSATTVGDPPPAAAPGGTIPASARRCADDRVQDTLSARSVPTPWPSRSGSRPSCAPTPAARRPSRARATRSPCSSTTSTAATPASRAG